VVCIQLKGNLIKYCCQQPQCPRSTNRSHRLWSYDLMAE